MKAGPDNSFLNRFSTVFLINTEYVQNEEVQGNSVLFSTIEPNFSESVSLSLTAIILIYSWRELSYLIEQLLRMFITVSITTTNTFYNNLITFQHDHESLVTLFYTISKGKAKKYPPPLLQATF